MIMTPSEAFDKIREKIRTAPVRRLADALVPHLVNEYRETEQGPRLEFRRPIKGVDTRWDGIINRWTIPLKGSAECVGEILTSPESELLDFYGYFDGFGDGYTVSLP